MRLPRLSSSRSRHLVAQRIFWNPTGERIARRVTRLAVLFDTVVRNFSLISDTNGEEWVSSLLPAEPTVFDVGFYQGDFAAQVLRRRPAARVYAFDPAKSALEAYSARFGDDPRVTLESSALAAAPGQAQFYDSENMCNSLSKRVENLESPRSYQVPLSTLDEFCAEAGIPHIHFLKVDAEGHDLPVLQGAGELLAAERVDIFMVEFGSGWIGSRLYLKDLVDYLVDKRYQLFRLFNGFLAPFTYSYRYDSAATLPGMYVGVSRQRLRAGDIPIRNLQY